MTRGEPNVRPHPSRITLGLGLGGLGLALAGTAWIVDWHSREEAAARGVDSISVPAARLPADVASGAPRRGSQSPLLTIVEYSEFECLSCQKLTKGLNDLVADHPEEIAIVWKDRPSTTLRPRSPIAAKVARAIYEEKGNAAFWTFHDRVFQNLSQLRDRDLVALGGSLGVDVQRVLASQSDALERGIQASVTESSALGVITTPSVFVNGWRMRGSVQDVLARVHRRLAWANSLRRQGLSHSEVVHKLGQALRDGSEEI